MVINVGGVGIRRFTVFLALIVGLVGITGSASVAASAVAGHEEEVETAAAPDTGSDLYAFNQGNGVIQTRPKVYLILWGNWTATGDPYNVQDRLYYFYNGLGGTGYLKVLSQYQQQCQAGTWVCTGAHIGTGNPFVAYWKDTITVPATPTHAQIEAEARRAAVHFQDYSSNAQYVIALPRGHGDTDFAPKGGGACAWHDATYVTGSSWVTFTALPYIPDAGLGQCGNGSINGSKGILDGVTEVAGHEFAESVSDPGLNAWYDDNKPLGDEIGDKCSTYVGNVKLSNGHTFPMQAVWSNYHRYYFGAGCVLTW